MNKIILQIKDTLKKLNNSSINYTQQPINNNVLNYIQNEFKNTRFTLAETNTYIQQFNTTSSIHTIYQLGSININILTTKQSHIPPRLLIERVIKRLAVVYNVFKINKQFNFWLIPTNVNRWFPKKGIVMPKHINGGFTYIEQHNDNGNGKTKENANIFIYRREEFPKVMIHELMHHSYVDISHNSQNIYQEQAFITKVKDLCDISSNTRFLPNEGIIEAWALLLQSLFISFEYHIPFNTIMNIENTWSHKQSARLLYYKNRKNHKNNIPKNGDGNAGGASNGDDDGENDWEETTNSYCYIIIKTLLLKDINGFVNNSINNNITPYIEKSIVKYLPKIIPQPLKHTHFRMTMFGDL